MIGFRQFRLVIVSAWIIAAGSALPLAAQLSADWMVPAAAHNPGARDTFWMTDLSLHNPHEYDLEVVVQALPSETENYQVPTLSLSLSPWQTLNLWDVLGPGTFDLAGTAAILAYADPGLACDPIETCHFLVTSRTYTPDASGNGEFGLTVPGKGVEGAADWESLAYAAGILNDGTLFRCNAGVASWTPEWTTVRLDIQDADGRIVESELFDIPPYGHIQRRIAASGEGGSLVFYLDSGPGDALVFPYATVINQETGDASYYFAEASTIGIATAKRATRLSGRPPHPEANGGTVKATGPKSIPAKR